MYERLDVWRERVAALFPVPPVVDAKTHIVERVVHSGADAVASGHAGGGESPAGLRRHLSGAATQLREQASAWYYRAADPTPLAGARPGAVAAAVAGCLAIGGGATYCVQQGADPFTALAGLGSQPHHERKPPNKPKPHHPRATVAQAPVPPVVVPTATTPTPTVQQTPTPTPTTTTKAAPPPAPEDQFEPTSAGASTSTTTATTASKPKKPAPAPAGGPGEFDGP
jgi:hypothetical protein